MKKMSILLATILMCAAASACGASATGPETQATPTIPIP